MLVAERRQPCLVFWLHGVAFAAQLRQHRIHVQRVPKHDHVHDQAERAQLVFLPFAVALEQLAALAVENLARQAVAAFTEIQLQQRGATAGFVVDEIQRVDGLVDTADFGDGLRQAGGPFIDL